LWWHIGGETAGGISSCEITKRGGASNIIKVTGAFRSKYDLRE